MPFYCVSASVSSRQAVKIFLNQMSQTREVVTSVSVYFSKSKQISWGEVDGLCKLMPFSPLNNAMPARVLAAQKRLDWKLSK